MYKENATKAIAKKRYSFKKGYYKISLEQKVALKQDLMAVLGISSRYYFSHKLNKGILDIPITLFDAINQVFQKYDITDIWDITDEE